MSSGIVKFSIGRALPAIFLLAASCSLCAQVRSGAIAGGESTRTADSGNIKVSKRKVAPTLSPDIKNGYEALRKSNLYKAQEAFRAALRRDGAQRDALLGLAHASHALGDDASTLSAITRLKELYPRDGEALAASFLIYGGDLSDTESRFKYLSETIENPAPLLFSLGVLYGGQGRWGEARTVLERAVALVPDQADYVFNLAVASDQLGLYAVAARLYSSALNLSSQLPAAFNRDVARSRARVLVGMSPYP